MKKLIVCLVVLSSLYGCSDNLSKGKAEDMIRANIEEKHQIIPMYVHFDVNGNPIIYIINYAYLNNSQISQLYNEGYIQGDKKTDRSVENITIRAFTDKAAPFISTVQDGPFQGSVDLKLATIEKLEVSSVTCGEEKKDEVGHTRKSCEAKWSIHLKPNALGEKLKIGVSDNFKLAQTGKALFYFEDKVWRFIGVDLDQQY